jgi:hypothetical protein
VPVVSGLLAMAMAARRERRGAGGAAAAVAELLENQIAVSGVPAGTTKAFAALPLSMAGALEPPSEPPGELPDPAQLKFSELEPPPRSAELSALIQLVAGLVSAAVFSAVAAVGFLLLALFRFVSFWGVVPIAAVGALLGATAMVVLQLSRMLTTTTPQDQLVWLALYSMAFIAIVVASIFLALARRGQVVGTNS